MSTDVSSSKELSLVVANLPQDKDPEPSVILLDKQASSLSDVQKEEARYQTKRNDALAVFRGKSDRTRKLAASQQSSYTENGTAKMIVPNKRSFRHYKPFAPIDKKQLKELAEWLKTDP